ncbi:hypothetical protein HIM_07378 [Hirsutella minnesotensis 3608]|uniref:Zn(2)-C6 fungal-type domain-containing protein n=1 Tax=Hirsutella minnesotensis 3608 TaxID=1043627 RepID=A0A0F7ZHV8_9HYPO|nr:hypothetical protein HIM_07378 [Hirsutella minnesotensis 3608]
MSPGGEGEQEEAASLTYPSPGAEALDAGPFYNANRDGVPDHQHNPDHAGHPDHQDHSGHQVHQDQPDQQHQHAPEQIHPQDQDQAHMQAQDPHSPQQHVSRPANLEELQLAAQLGDGLAGTPMMPATDPSMNVDDHNMRNIMPHPEPEHHQTPSYVQDTPTADHLAQHSMPVPVGPPVPQYQMGDGIPPRKRSKVSRACDECRRKKIKCDAQSDTGDNPCSSCARSAIRCLFSRVPQKRGPSKGYIKELADRIHSIENKLESEGNLTQDDIDKLFAADRPRSHGHGAPGDDLNRKRPFSSISTGDLNTPMSSRQAPWGSEARPGMPVSASSDSFAHQVYGNHALAPQPSAIKPDETPSRPPVAAMDVSMPEIDELPIIDEGLLRDFHATIQPLFPIMPSSTARIQGLLSQCPQSLRTAFSIAFSTVGQPSPGDVKHADDLLREWERGDVPSSRASDIVHAQTLMLLIIDADWRVLPTLPFLLARAVALSNTMKLWKLLPVESADPDSDDQLCLKFWWSVILMDRWYAAGTGSPALVPDSSVVAGAGLLTNLGEVCFHLMRLSKLLNRIAYVISTIQPGATTADAAMATILGDYIENYREDLPAHVDAASYPLIHLAYWHCRLLVTLLTPGATAAETLWPTRELANLLSASDHLQNPLMHHFVSLVVLSLSKLIKADRSREEATQLIKEISEKAAGSHWDGVQERLSELRTASSVEATASQGLQHLADLATAHEGVAPGEGIVPGEGELAFGPSLASGYLEVA